MLRQLSFTSKPTSSERSAASDHMKADCLPIHWDTCSGKREGGKEGGREGGREGGGKGRGKFKKGREGQTILSLQKQNCSFNKDLCHVSCTCKTVSILSSHVVHNHNISLSCGPQHSPKWL